MIGSTRIIRSGSWRDDADFSRSACRDLAPPSHSFNVLGFRLSRTGHFSSYHFAPVRLLDRPWTPLSNPHFVGPPVFGDKRFFGRDRELQQILSMLAGGISQPILIRGPRRIGKTSLLKHIEWLWTNPDELRKYRLGSEQIAQIRTIRPVFVDLQCLSGTGADASTQFFHMLLQDSYRVLEHGESVPFSDQTLDPTRAYQRAIDAILSTCERSLLVIIDEWDALSSVQLSNLGANLRSVLVNESRVRWLISSTWIVRDEMQYTGSPLHNMCAILEIADLTRENALAMLTEPSASVGLRWNADAAILAAEWTGQQPYLIGILGGSVVELLNEERGSAVVDIELVQNVIGRMVRGAFPNVDKYFRSIFREVGPTGDDSKSVRALGWMILWVLDQAYPDPLSREEIRRRIDELILTQFRSNPDGNHWFYMECADQIDLLGQVDLVIAADKFQQYQIRVPLFRAWFHRAAPDRYNEMLEILRNDHARASQGLNS